MCSIKANESRGFSIIEVMVTIFIGAILTGIVSSNLPQLKRVADRFLDQAFFEEQYLIFLLKLEDEYHQAAVYGPGEIGKIDQLLLEQDQNLDGDLNDSGEKIAYRWNDSEKRIDRKSGSGYFQSMLEGVTGFSWSRVRENPVCHELLIQNAFSQTQRKTRYCLEQF